MNRTDLKELWLLVEHCTFVRSLDAEGTSDVPKGIHGNEDSWDLEGIAIVEDVATSGIRRKFRDVQRIYEDGS